MQTSAHTTRVPIPDVATSIAALKFAAQQNPALLPKINSQLKAAGFEFGATGRKRASASRPVKFGDLVEGKGIYAGPYAIHGATKDAYFEPDFLRDTAGNVLTLFYVEAMKALTYRNGGRAYGRFDDIAVSDAIVKHKYKDGDLILAPLQILIGRTTWCAGERVSRPDNLFSLLQSGNKSVENIRAALKKSKAKCSLSSANYNGISYEMCVADLSDGKAFRVIHGAEFPAAIVPLRLFSPSP